MCLDYFTIFIPLQTIISSTFSHFEWRKPIFSGPFFPVFKTGKIKEFTKMTMWHWHWTFDLDTVRMFGLACTYICYYLQIEKGKFGIIRHYGESQIQSYTYIFILYNNRIYSRKQVHVSFQIWIWQDMIYNVNCSK